MKRNEAFKRWLEGVTFAVMLWVVLTFLPPPRNPLVGEPLGTFKFEPPTGLVSPTLNEQMHGPPAPRDPPSWWHTVYPLGRSARTYADPPEDPAWAWRGYLGGGGH